MILGFLVNNFESGSCKGGRNSVINPIYVMFQQLRPGTLECFFKAQLQRKQHEERVRVVETQDTLRWV